MNTLKNPWLFCFFALLCLTRCNCPRSGRKQDSPTNINKGDGKPVSSSPPNGKPSQKTPNGQPSVEPVQQNTQKPLTTVPQAPISEVKGQFEQMKKTVNEDEKQKKEELDKLEKDLRPVYENEKQELKKQLEEVNGQLNLEKDAYRKLLADLLHLKSQKILEDPKSQEVMQSQEQLKQYIVDLNKEIKNLTKQNNLKLVKLKEKKKQQLEQVLEKNGDAQKCLQGLKELTQQKNKREQALKDLDQDWKEVKQWIEAAYERLRG